MEQRYQAAANRRSAESIATAQNITQANAGSAELEGRRQQQEFSIEAQRNEQARQIAAEIAMQERRQQFEMARMQIPITAEENRHNTAMMNGLAQLDQQVKNGYLTEEQASPYRLELVTGINQFQRREQMQRGQAIEQQRKMETQQFELINKNQMMAEAASSELAKKGVFNWYDTDPRTGETEFLAFNPKTGDIYNPKTGGGRGEQKHQPVSRYDDGFGGFDYSKALKYAKDEAESAYPILKEPKAGGTGEVDVNASKRAGYQTELIDRYANEHRSGMTQAAKRGQGQQAPVTAPQQQQNPKQMLQDLLNRYPDPSKAPPEVIAEVRRLKAMSN